MNAPLEVASLGYLAQQRQWPPGKIEAALRAANLSPVLIADGISLFDAARALAILSPTSPTNERIPSHGSENS